jgi:alpha-galactosidase
MPWFLIKPMASSKDAESPVWWGQIHYSGNWKILFDNAYDANYNFTLQVAAGISFWDTDWTLKPNETFITPKFSTGYSSSGADDAAIKNAAYVRKEILPASNRNELRPVLFNSWYATTYNINEKDQIAMAKTASKIGVELFCIDDGWFKNRVKSTSGLGDWEVDKIKFPNGLEPMIDSIHNMGMKFGIWVEPESVVLESDVYRNHPDWILQYPKGETPPYRVFLNLAKKEVYDYLYKSLDKLLTNNKIDFIKWDQNSTLSATGWPDAPADMQKEVRIQFISNLYKLVDELKLKHPNVLFESCASGGGRVDLGMLSRMDQAWVSDNSTAVDRLFIQYGYLSALPANTMVSWVIESIAGQKQLSPSLPYKFDVAMSGVLGIGYDIRKFNVSELEIAKNKIATYKMIRPMVQQGDVYRLVSPLENNRSALQYNSATKDKAVLFCYNMGVYLSAGYSKIAPLKGGQINDRTASALKLKGLLPNQQYTIKDTNDKADSGKVYSGDFLMNVGLAWPLKNSFESKILTITAL